MRKKLNKNYRDPNREMAEIMVAQWTDERLKSAVSNDIMRSFGVTITQADAILKRELQKRKWL